MTAKKKLNAFGKASNVKHIRLYNWIMDTAAWSSLSLGARCLLLEIWRRNTGQNNGQISFSQQEGVKALSCSASSVSRWSAELQEKGFLVVTRASSFDWKNGMKDHRATEWRLTMEPCKDERPTKEFASWGEPKKQNADTVADAYGYSGGYNSLKKPKKKPECIRESIHQPPNSTAPCIRESITYSLPGRGGRDWLHLGESEEANHVGKRTIR